MLLFLEGLLPEAVSIEDLERLFNEDSFGSFGEECRFIFKAVFGLTIICCLLIGQSVVLLNMALASCLAVENAL